MTVLRNLTAGGTIDRSIESVGLSDDLLQQFTTYQSKYGSTLILADQINSDGAGEEETNAYAMDLLRRKANERDEQLGHLEALKRLFEEALQCTTLRFGVTADGHAGPPTRMHHVRGGCDVDNDSGRARPNDEHAPKLISRTCATVEEAVRSSRGCDVIVAVSAAGEKIVVLYGAEKVRQFVEQGQGDYTKWVVAEITVRNFEELQSAIAAVRKYIGNPDTDGSGYRDHF